MAVIRTLELMAEIYRLPMAGGAESVRFRRYVELCADHPIHTYNPMTARPETLATVEQLIEIDAERIVEESVRDRTLSVSVLTPGLWTDRSFTDLQYRLDALPLAWFWSGEEVDAVAVQRATRLTAARVEDAARFGPVEDLRGLALREGRTMRRADVVPPEVVVDRAADAMNVVGGEFEMGSFIAWVHGDQAATDAGYTGLGLEPGVGLRWGWEHTVEGLVSDQPGGRSADRSAPVGD